MRLWWSQRLDRALRCFVECMLNLDDEFMLQLLTLVWCFYPSPKHFHRNHLIWYYQQHSKRGQSVRDMHILKLWELRWRRAVFMVSFLCLFDFFDFFFFFEKVIDLFVVEIILRMKIYCYMMTE